MQKLYHDRELKIAINNKENWCATIGSRPQGAGSTDEKFTTSPWPMQIANDPGAQIEMVTLYVLRRRPGDV